MKNFKKIAVILLCLTLAFSLFACGEEEPPINADEACKEHVDADKNGKCDVCNAALDLDGEKEDPTKEDPTTEDPTNDPTIEDPTNDPTIEDPTEDAPTVEDPTKEEPTVDDPTKEDPTEEEKDPTKDEEPSEIERYFDAIEEAIKGANTVKLTATILMNQTSGEYEENINGVVEAIIAKTEAGVSIKLVSKELLENGKYGQIYDAYIMGDKVYTYTGEGNEYYEFDLSNKEMDGSLAGIVGGISGIELPEISENDLLMLRELLVAAFEETFALDANGNLVFEVDAAPTINATLDELKAIDYEKQTIGQAINEFFAKAGTELTIEQILDELKANADVTMQENYDTLNAILLENAGMNDKEIIVMAVEKAGGVDAIVEKLAPMLSSYGLTAEEVGDMVDVAMREGLKAFLTPDMLALTTEQFILSILQSTGAQFPADQEITIEALVESVKSNVLATPLITVVGQEFVDYINATEVNKLGGDVALEFGENFAIEGIKVNTGVDMKFPTVVYQYDIELDDFISYMVNGSIKLDVSLDLTIEDTVTEIKLPDDAVILEDAPIQDGIDENKGNNAFNGKYELNHIVVENISSGEEKIYNLGDSYYGMLLTADRISVELKEGYGVMSYSFEESVTTDITYQIVDETFFMVCEEAVDIFNDGNSQYVYELLIDEVDGKTCLVLTAVNQYSIFSYYVIAQ